MPKKRRVTRSTHSIPHSGKPAHSAKPEPAENQNRFIQIAAVVILVIAIAVIIISVVNSQMQYRATQQESGLQATALAMQNQAAVPQSNQAPTQAAASQSTQASQPQPVASAKQYSAYPEMTIDKTKQYLATVKMAKGGEFEIQLYADKAPLTVNSFVFLAKQGFFNGVTFHRVLQGFMAQGGDPTGTGMGGPGYEFKNEDSDLTFDKAGVVAMANAGRDTNGSQFFITFGPQTQLNGGYTIFGQVIKGMDVVNGIRLRDPEQNPDYPGDAIESVTITEK